MGEIIHVCRQCKGVGHIQKNKPLFAFTWFQIDQCKMPTADYTDCSLFKCTVHVYRQVIPFPLSRDNRKQTKSGALFTLTGVRTFMLLSLNNAQVNSWL